MNSAAQVKEVWSNLHQDWWNAARLINRPDYVPNWATYMRSQFLDVNLKFFSSIVYYDDWTALCNTQLVEPPPRYGSKVLAISSA